MKYGFELEAFCREPIILGHEGKWILVPTGLPYDECGWLAEIRSEPHTNIIKAIALLQAERKIVEAMADKANCVLVFEPLTKIPRELKVAAARKHGKGLLKYKNIYGHETHKCRTDLATASLHVSFTNEVKFSYKDGKQPREYVHQGFIDHAKLIVGLDRAFKEEIKSAQRNPGFYEAKDDGRVEYRSLPNNIDLDKLAEVLERIK